MMILDNAARKIHRFNEVGLHYKLLADQIYKKRKSADPFADEYVRYVIAGLISFDMGRMMGSGSRYDVKGKGFAARLNKKLRKIRPLLEPLINLHLTEIKVQENSAAIIKIYNTLSAKGEGALHSNSKRYFHVGATKILHFLNPCLFIIVDRNAARAFKMTHNIPFRKNAPFGFSAERYIKCLEFAKDDILKFGVKKFQDLEPDTPITRIYDKLTFATGAGL